MLRCALLCSDRLPRTSGCAANSLHHLQHEWLHHTIALFYRKVQRVHPSADLHRQQHRPVRQCKQPVLCIRAVLQPIWLVSCWLCVTVNGRQRMRLCCCALPVEPEARLSGVVVANLCVCVSCMCMLPPAGVAKAPLQITVAQAARPGRESAGVRQPHPRPSLRRR